MCRRVLVVTPVAPDPQVLARAAGPDAVTQVVVPAARLSRLQWLTNEEDEARAAAEVAADVTETTTDERTHATVGDSDPAQAVEDALRTFAADEIVIVTRPDAEADWLEGGSVAEAVSRFDVPVRHVVAGETGDVEAPTAAVRPVTEPHEVARGADEATPARLMGRVALVVFSAVLLVLVLILLIMWLV